MENLSNNQKIFVHDAENEGYEVNYGYSGRGMYGEICPSVLVDNIRDFHTQASHAWDGMGKQIVIYAPN